jgi:O-antigen/teichoic acid export membrane protein
LLKRNLIANYFGNGWTAFIGLAFIPLYIKILGIESYALIGIFGVIQTWLGLLDMGMTPTLSREMARFTGGLYSSASIRDLLRSIEFVAIIIAILIIVGVALASTWLAISWLQAGDLPTEVVAQSLIIMGFVAALRFLEGIYRSALIGLQRQVLLNIFNVAISTLRAIGGIGALVWISPTIEMFFLWQAFIALTSLAILVFITYAALPNAAVGGKFSMKALQGIWKFAGGMTGITFLALLLTSVDKVILAKLLALSEYGYYTLASVVAGALYLVVNPITMTWFPRLCQLHAAKDDAGMVRAYHQGAQLVSVVAGSAAVVIMINAQTLLQIWTQDTELAFRTAPLLSLLVLGNLLNALMWIPYQTQLAYGWTSLGVRGNICAVIVIVPAIFFVTPHYGAIGAGWVWVGLNASYCLIGIHFMFRRILKSEKWIWYRDDVLRPIFSAACVASMFKLLLPSATSDLAMSGLLICASIATLLAAFLASKTLRHSLRKSL